MFLNWAFIVIGVVLFFMAFFIKRQVITILTNSLLALNFVFLGLNRFLNKRNDRFLQINETGLEWQLAEYLDSKNSPVKISIPWDEIHWIKKEPLDEGITIYEASSFSNHAPLKNFSTDERDSILSILKEISLARKIRLVNF
jgi:hypothetical protein